MRAAVQHGDGFALQVHQSYTMDEGVAILVLWTGRHTNISDRASTVGCGALLQPRLPAHVRRAEDVRRLHRARQAPLLSQSTRRSLLPVWPLRHCAVKRAVKCSLLTGVVGTS